LTNGNQSILTTSFKFTSQCAHLFAIKWGPAPFSLLVGIQTTNIGINVISSILKKRLSQKLTSCPLVKASALRQPLSITIKFTLLVLSQIMSFHIILKQISGGSNISFDPNVIQNYNNYLSF